MKGKKPIVINGSKSYSIHSSSKGKKSGGCGCGKTIRKK